jgi:tetratricopeptide (TPR) repeat protein
MFLRICAWSIIAASFLLAETPQEPLAAPATFARQIAGATSYLESGNLRRAEEILLELSRLQEGKMDELEAAILANVWGCLHLKQGRFGQARTELAGALSRISEDRGGSQLTATLLYNLTAAEIQLALYAEALLHQQEAIRRWQMRLPASHPVLIKSYGTLATVQYMLNDAAAAHVSMLTAIDSARHSLGDRSPLLADLLESHAIILRRLGLKSDAKAAEMEARHIRRPNHPEADALTVDVKTLMRTCGLACR